MNKRTYKIVSMASLLVISASASALAEGIFDIKPYISTNISYDDNVFRFTSPEQAAAAFGSPNTSDVVKRVDLGVNVNLRLDRQLLTLASSINESKYDRFNILNNTGNANKLAWNWRLGNDVYGELSTSRSEAIAGFNEIKQPVKNLRTSSHQLASINWNFQPNWTLNASREFVKTENQLVSFNALDREDDVYETAIRYQNQLGTQLGLAYRIADSTFLNRTGFAKVFFGDKSTQNEIVATAAWMPSTKTRISARLAQVSLSHKDLPQRDFNGFSQRWNLDHTLTDKTTVNLTAYQEIYPVDDVLSTYVKAKGFGVNPSWSVSSKVSLRGGLGYEDRSYLGAADRDNQSKLANLSLIYTPTNKSLVQIQYQGENRTSSTANISYKFNNVNLLMRYDF